MQKETPAQGLLLCAGVYIFIYFIDFVWSEYLHKEYTYMFNWPQLELTEYERQYVRPYKCIDDETDAKGNIVLDKNGKPKKKAYHGVLNRIYHRVLTSQALPNKNLPNIVTTEQIQIARRSRVYALSFAGNVDRWGINIATASGTQFTTKLPRSHRDPIVSSIYPGTLQNYFSSDGNNTQTYPAANNGYFIGPAIFSDREIMFPLSQPFPELIEPNWLLTPNETLIFNGTPYETVQALANPPVEGDQTYNTPVILHITAYVWEFPGMENVQ